MDISVEDITSVDKQVKISATREDLAPKFKEAYKKYQGQINMPGFRPGKVPLQLIKKRFGEEIEEEEVGKYVQEIFEKEVVPEYDPIGESQMIDMSWENDQLEATFKIGARPEFELTDLGSIEVDKMVHDVSDEEVQEEVERQLQQQGDWNEVEEEVDETSRVLVEAIPVDDDGNLDEENKANEVIDLNKEESKEFKDDLLGHKAGDEVDVEVGHGDHSHSFKLKIQKVEKSEKAKLTDAFAKEQTNEEAKNVDEYKSLIKSQIQNYYDQSADDLFKRDMVDKMVEAHEFEVPEVFIEQFKDQYVERVKQQNQGQLPPDFDPEEYKEGLGDRAVRDAKWFFINEKLQEKFDDIEIKPDDIDEHLSAQAAQYGVSVDQMRNMFAQNPQQLEGLRNSIRENKVFDRLGEEIKINEISKDEYEDAYQKKMKASEEAEEALEE
ncbi:trigger factor [Aliifodinibius sp. S!AR15-10]|uniref:trigger factor n=1 Tax=Aliifodinibius sp. S!AR15-10 TaxID=2950437 RepID=UPI002864C464|nr:trigger factor [Aliifodinibius sp. S!AR15-10]MDR8394167.1 trigger factor [Aliifodinibius sp. S!AR15-10]